MLVSRHQAGIGRDLWRSSSPAPCSKQGHLEQIAQGCGQSEFAYLQGWRLCNLSGQPVPAHGHPYNRKDFFSCSERTSQPLKKLQATLTYFGSNLILAAF